MELMVAGGGLNIFELNNMGISKAKAILLHRSVSRDKFKKKIV